MFIVITYDITDNKRRNRLRKLLLGYGEPVQLSVFECGINGKDLKDLQWKIKKLIKNSEDSVRYYHLCQDCKNKIEANREGDLLRDKRLIIV
ncbi:CRISPR-associated endonuclease Cas2 [bacterium]|nr:CRISPR-associated endonuclease Cas2 [bacterium]